MRFDEIINGEKITFTSINLCDYDEKGDYEIYPDKEFNLPLLKMNEYLKNHKNTNCISSKELAIIKLPDYEITFYSSGRCILEGISPSEHEEAYRIYKEIFNLIVKKK